MNDGRFIAVEGIDGAGTTSAVERIAARLRAEGREVHATREPSTGPVGTMIRQVLSHRLVVPGASGPKAPGWVTMALLFAADRQDHLEAEVLPLLERGVTVITDRYDLSSLAYQSATSTSVRAPGDAVAFIRELNRHARRPDLTLVFDVSPAVAAERRRARGASHELYEKAELQARLARAYAEAETLVPGDAVVHIDADQPLDAVIAAALSAIASMGGRRA
jgi:dTMP kinase